MGTVLGTTGRRTGGRGLLAAAAALLAVVALARTGVPVTQAQDQGDGSGYWTGCWDHKWYIYVDIRRPTPYPVLKLEYGGKDPTRKDEPLDDNPQEHIVVGVYKTCPDAARGACAQMKNLRLDRRTYNSPLAEINGRTCDVGLFVDDKLRCSVLCSDADGDGVADDADGDGVADGEGIRYLADACPATPAGTPVGMIGCPCEPQTCQKWCKDKFAASGLPDRTLRPDLCMGEPPDCQCRCELASGRVTEACFRRDCEAVCRQEYDPHSKWNGDDPETCEQCICIKGYQSPGGGDPRRCAPCQEVCAQKDKRVTWDEKNSEDERCACTCDKFKMLEYNAQTRRCDCVSFSHPEGDICACNVDYEPAPLGGCQPCALNCTSSGQHNEHCQPAAGYEWKDSSHTACVPVSENVDASALQDFLLHQKGYSPTKVTKETFKPASYPPGTVVLWERVGQKGATEDQDIAHSSVVINEQGDQIAMGAEEVEIVPHDRAPPPPSKKIDAKAQYAPVEVWLPPARARLNPKVKDDLVGRSSEVPQGLPPSQPAAKGYNCHGFTKTAVKGYVRPPDPNPGASLPSRLSSRRAHYGVLADPPGEPFALELYSGAIHGDGVALEVFLPHGYVGLTNEFLVDVGDDGSAQVYVLGGMGIFYADVDSPAVSVAPNQMITIRQGSAPRPVAFDPDTLQPWWEGPASPVCGAAAIAAGLALVTVAGTGVVLWQASRGRRPAPAAARTRPPSAPVRWQLLVSRGQATPARLALDKAVISLGRGSDNDLVLVERFASRRHAQIRREKGAAVVYDLGSTNGTYVNGARISGPLPLEGGDVIRIGQVELVFGTGSQRQQPAPGRCRLVVRRGRASQRSLSLDQPVVTIGRSSGSDLVLEDAWVSRRHAEIRRQEEAMILHDLGSTHGTFVNGRRITEPHRLHPGEVIGMGQTELVWR